jgi:hypothetical protein
VRRGANMDKKKCRLPEMVKGNYVTLPKVKSKIDKKYMQGSFYIKSQAKLDKLYDVATNVFNNPNPIIG